jgi:enterochelin esterase-like enzyme
MARAMAYAGLRHSEIFGNVLCQSGWRRSSLLAKGYGVHYQQFNSCHDNWRAKLADGLIALVGTEAARPPSR